MRRQAVIPFLLLMAWSSPARADCTLDLIVVVEGFNGAEGQAGVAVFDAADGFPLDADKARTKATGAIVDGTATLSFPGLPAGTYAVAAMHDKDLDGKLDRNWVGKPTEGYAVSNNAKAGRFSAPSFEDARFEARCGEQIVRLRVGY